MYMNFNKYRVEVWICRVIGVGFYELGKIQFKDYMNYGI